MQLKDMVGRIRKTLGEVESGGYGTQADGDGSWDNSQIIGYINEALDEMSHIWRKEAAGTLAVATAGQYSFTPPADCMEDGIRSLLYVTGGNQYPARWVTLDGYQRHAVDTANPVGQASSSYIYTVWGGNILIYPGISQTTDSLSLKYYRTIVHLANATEVPEIPIRFHMAPCFYAIRECQNAVEEVNLEFDADGKWQRELNRFRMEMSRNQRDGGIRMRGRR